MRQKNLTRAEVVKNAKIELAKRQLASRDIFEFTKYTFRKFRKEWENWHQRTISNFVQKVVEKEYTRAMIWAPPRHMKTETMERTFSYALGKDPDLKLMLTAHTAAKADKISGHIKANVTDTCFGKVFSEFPGIKGLNKINNWSLGGENRAEVLSAGINGPITGEGFDLGYIDDPVKSRKEAESPTYQEATYEWYDDTFLTRQDEADSGILITNTRWTRKDLSGKIIEKDGIASYNGRPAAEGCPEWNGDPDGVWHILCLCAEMDKAAWDWRHPDDPRQIGEALWPQRFPAEFLAQFKKNKYNWNSAYQQRPRPRGGNLINRAWFPIVDQMPPGAKILRFWDFASTPKLKSKKNDPDFTAGGLVGFKDKILYIGNVTTTRDTPFNIEALVKQTAFLDDALHGEVRQYWEEEGGASGKHMSEHYMSILAAHWRQAYRVGKNKEFYIDLLANKAEAGEVRLVKGKWLGEVHDGNTFLDEAEEYPKGRHDDRIDAVAKACYIHVGDPPTLADAIEKALKRGDKQLTGVGNTSHLRLIG